MTLSATCLEDRQTILVCFFFLRTVKWVRRKRKETNGWKIKNVTGRFPVQIHPHVLSVDLPFSAYQCCIFALFILFAIRVYSLLVIRDYSLFAIRVFQTPVAGYPFGLSIFAVQVVLQTVDTHFSFYMIRGIPIQADSSQV